MERSPNKGIKRTSFCLDKFCKPLWHSAENIEEGFSSVCVGKLREPFIFKFRKVEHKNDYSYCIYTPLKGVVRLYVNAGDAWTDKIALTRILDDFRPLKCKECGTKGRLSNFYVQIGNETYCELCALRLEKIKWHPKSKQYY